MIKILAIADRRPEASLKEMVEKNKPDVIVTLGDLEYFEIQYLEAVVNIPKLGVYGNHCSGKYFDELGITNMHMQSMEIKGVKFGGFEGCVRYKDSKYAKMYTQEEMSSMMINFPYVDIMLVHCPPYGVNDEPGDPTHEGFKGLRKYVEEVKPKHLLHGHTYPDERNMVHKLGFTSIHYVSGVRILNLEI